MRTGLPAHCGSTMRSIGLSDLRPTGFGNSRGDSAFFRRFRRLYPPLSIPNVYCVVGVLDCSTVVSESGILVGAETFGRTERTVLDVLDSTQKHRLSPLAPLPGAVMHELTHFQQRAVAEPNGSLLSKAIREGVAVLLAELVTGRRDDRAPHIYGDVHEVEVWEAFRAEMGGSRDGEWLGDHVSKEGLPPNLGGYVGCQICRAFLRRCGQKEGIRALVEAEKLEEIFKRSGYGG